MGQWAGVANVQHLSILPKINWMILSPLQQYFE
jgi:hypothetical protein